MACCSAFHILNLLTPDVPAFHVFCFAAGELHFAACIVDSDGDGQVSNTGSIYGVGVLALRVRDSAQLFRGLHNSMLCPNPMLRCALNQMFDDRSASARYSMAKQPRDQFSSPARWRQTLRSAK